MAEVAGVASASSPVAPNSTWRPAWIWLAISIAFGLVTDLASKWAAFRWIADQPAVVRRADVLASGRLSDLLPMHDPVVVVPSLLNLTLVLNPGAVFGLGAGKRWLFVGFTCVAIVFALWVFLKWTTPRDRAAHVAIGLVISGGLGNLYDRLVFACVRDFLQPLPGVTLPWGITWPNGSTDVWPYVSNIADLWLLVGIGVLLVFSWRHAPEERAEAGSDAH